MIIKHYPVTNVSKVEELYSEQDGVPVNHVCSTEFNDVIADIFYRDTPHPVFGNRYFAIYLHGDNDIPYIANADSIENLTFGMVENDDGQLEYSQSRHDYKSFNNGNMIDGGRDYIRSSHTGVKVFVVRDGQMIHNGIENNGR